MKNGLKTGSVKQGSSKWTVLAVLPFTVLVGCATLTNKGVIDADDKAAFCADVATACSAATLVNADETVRQACAALALICVAP